MKIYKICKKKVILIGTCKGKGKDTPVTRVLGHNGLSVSAADIATTKETALHWDRVCG
jgi:hypothetical protein